MKKTLPLQLSRFHLSDNDNHDIRRRKTKASFKEFWRIYLQLVVFGIVLDISGDGVGLYSYLHLLETIAPRWELFFEILGINFICPMFLFVLPRDRERRLSVAPVISILISAPGFLLIITDKYTSFISITWHVIMGLAVFVVVAGDYLLHRLGDQPAKKEAGYCFELLKLVLQGIIALGTILGVILSFLFRGGVSNLDLNNKIMGIQNLLGFLFTVIILYSFIVRPLLRHTAGSKA